MAYGGPSFGKTLLVLFVLVATAAVTTQLLHIPHIFLIFINVCVCKHSSYLIKRTINGANKMKRAINE